MMTLASAATGSASGSTTTLADPAIHPLKVQPATMEAVLKQIQLTMETERHTRSELRKSINNSLSSMTRGATGRLSPLGTHASSYRL